MKPATIFEEELEPNSKSAAAAAKGDNNWLQRRHSSRDRSSKQHQVASNRKLAHQAESRGSLTEGLLSRLGSQLAAGNQQPPSGYLGSLLHRSGVLLHSLKQQYSGAMQQQQRKSAGDDDNDGGSKSDIQKPTNVVQGAQETCQRPIPALNNQEYQTTSMKSATSCSPMTATSAKTNEPLARRHAIQEQSLERDAALSLKSRDLKSWRRTASIKSALRHAHHVLPTHHHKKPERQQSAVVGGRPYELFEPPVTQRTFQRSRRRGAMMSDPRRQLSADTLGLRQLTDEYLQNAGVKPAPSGAGLNLVALEPPGGAQTNVNVSAGGSAEPPVAQIEQQLYQKARRSQMLASSGGTDSTGSEDSLGYATAKPGQLPWQTEIGIQCNLLNAPKLSSGNDDGDDDNEPYESTGDILRTIAGPFRASSAHVLAQGSHNQASNMSFDASQLSASLKRGLTAIAGGQHHQHHLLGAPSGAQLTQVVGSLKKSLSNTLDISRMAQISSCAGGGLHSQDSLPAYSSLQNEPEDGGEGSGSSDSQQDPSLMNHLTCRLPSRRPSKKFSVSRKGLRRALSFDCRGYKRLDKQDQSPTNQQNQSTGNNLSPGGSKSSSNPRGKLTRHNKSSLCLNANHAGPRPYLPQSASQVDFQLPLLPYHKMQEAIVAGRLLDPTSAANSNNNNGKDTTASQFQTNDPDELICGTPQATSQLEEPLKPLKPVHHDGVDNDSERGTEPFCGDSGNRSSLRAATTKPSRLALDIPTIAVPSSSGGGGGGGSGGEESGGKPLIARDLRWGIRGNKRTSGDGDVEGAEDEDGEEVCPEEPAEAQVIVCLPSPNVCVEPVAFNVLPSAGNEASRDSRQERQKPLFCLDGANGGASETTRLESGMGEKQQSGSNRLLPSTNELFVSPKNLIKRPSTMLISNDAQDAMNQVAQALNSSTPAAAAAAAAAAKQQSRRSRRQAIVPPKLSTDPSGCEPDQGKLVDLGDDDEENEDQRRRNSEGHQKLETEEATMRALRRKRSGGAPEKQQQQVQVPTFFIEPDDEGPRQQSTAPPTPTSDLAERPRPDSQMTNIDSIVSSGSSANLSLSSRKDPFTVTSPGGLTVSFGSLHGRRRSSIAVIPQMQICPGDLLVYSKQLIDRMNQSEEFDQPAQLLTIDDKKAKNIWSSLKLCAQFDNRTMKAREELICSLEDVLASLQPSTFVDDQLYHYKGMLWNEFIMETETRRSAHSWVGSQSDLATTKEPDCTPDETRNDRVQIQVTSSPMVIECVNEHQNASNHNSSYANSQDESSVRAAREALKQTMSSTSTSQIPKQGPTPAAGGARPLISRFREKPKLKRGQTVDSVFRIPLIPSSPLKHAQQHQQTPTAHLEDHELTITIEDDEVSLTSLGSVTGHQSSTKHRSSTSTGHTPQHRGRHQVGAGEGSQSQLDAMGENGQHHRVADQDSSFETDDALDLMMSRNGAPSRTPHQMVRQSSLTTLSSTLTRTEQKRQRALWDLFQSECAFFFDHLLTLKNVYMEPLKKIQVEGFAMFADPDVLFGNLDELCCGVYDFCKEFLYIIMRTLKTRPEELSATDVLIKLYKKNPKIDHLRGVYHRYTLNYINALTYLESLRRQVEFVEFEKWSSRDARCKKLQLTDLLVAPVQHIMRVPIILRDIESHTENPRDQEEIRAILAVEEASLRELDDKIRWLKNFERLLEIQKSISWPSVFEMDSKLFVPEFLKDVLSKQPCERLIVSPKRQIVYEGTLSNMDMGRACDMHVILFDDMLLLTRRKKGLAKKASTICKTNSGGSSTKDDGSFKYIVYKQPLSLDRFYVHDVPQVDAQAIGMRQLFLLIVMNRFQQIINVHSFSAPNEDLKQTWLFKIKKTVERWKKNFANNPAEQQHQNAGAAVNHNLNQQYHQQQISHKASTPVNELVMTQESSSAHQSPYRKKAVSNIAPANSPVTVAQPRRVQAYLDATPSSPQLATLTKDVPDFHIDQQQKHQIELVVTSATPGTNSNDTSTYSNVTSTA